jgi:hypothetical protein
MSNEQITPDKDDDFLFIEPISMLPVDGLTLAWIALIIIGAAIIGLIVLCSH